MCNAGSVPKVTLNVTSQKKVYLNGSKLVATVKDTTFPPVPFGVCSRNPSRDNSCKYQPSDWKMEMASDHPVAEGKAMLTENGKITCPIFGGEITIVEHGQQISVASGASEEVDESVASAVNCTYEPTTVPEKTSKQNSVKSITYNSKVKSQKQTVQEVDVRTSEELVFKAELANASPITWAIWNRKDAEKSPEVKDENIRLFPLSGADFSTVFERQGGYFVEAFGQKYEAKTKCFIDCLLLIHAHERNKVTAITATAAIPVSDGFEIWKECPAVFSLQTLLPPNADDLSKLVVEIRDSTGTMVKSASTPIISFTPANEGVYTLTASFGDDSEAKTCKIYSISNRVNKVTCDAGDKVRPGTTVTFRAEAHTSSDLDKIAWEINGVKEEASGDTFKYTFRYPGKFKIRAYIKQLFVKIKGDERLLEVVRNSVTSVRIDKASPVYGDEIGLTAGIIYPRLDTSRNEYVEWEITPAPIPELPGISENGIELTRFTEIKSAPDAQNYKYTGMTQFTVVTYGLTLHLRINQLGSYIVRAKVVDEASFKFIQFAVGKAEINEWYFRDSEFNAQRSQIGWKQAFEIHAKVIALTNKTNIKATLWFDDRKSSDFNKRFTKLDVSELNEALKFDEQGELNVKIKADSRLWSSLENLDFKNEASLFFTLSNIQTPFTNWDFHMYQTKIQKHIFPQNTEKTYLYVVPRLTFSGKFIDDKGEDLRRIVKYGEKVSAVIYLMPGKGEALANKKYTVILRENIKGFTDLVRTAVVEQAPNAEGVMKFEVKTNGNGILEADHKDKPYLPRLFYFVLYEKDKFDAPLYVCPTNYGQNGQNDSYIIPFIDPQYRTAEQNDILVKSALLTPERILNYYLQLKVAKETTLNKSLSGTGVKIGAPIGGSYGDNKCPNCDKEVTADEIKQMFPNATQAACNGVAAAYTKYMRGLGMNTCWLKAHFFAQAAVETGYKLDVKEGENMNYSKDRFLNVFKSRLFIFIKIDGVSQVKIDKNDPNAHDDGRVFKNAATKQKIKEMFEIPPGNDRAKALANYIYADANGAVLGNTQDGDGWRFRGRGLVQLTGRGNYTAVTKEIKHVSSIDILTDSGADEVGKNLELAVLTSMGYFKMRKAHTVANGKMDVDPVSKKVGGRVGTNYEDKAKFFKEKSAVVFKVSECLLEEVEQNDSGVCPNCGHLHKDIAKLELWQSQFDPIFGTKKEQDVACFMACLEMVKRYGITGVGKMDSIITASQKNSSILTPVNPTDGNKYIYEQIKLSKPVIVGVDNGSNAKYNFDDTTEHYVVIVGCGCDNGKRYFRYFDPGRTQSANGASINNKLTIDDRGIASGFAYGTKTYTIAHVRINNK